MMDDLYVDLEVADVTEELNEIRTKNQTLKDEITKLNKDLLGTTEKCSILEKENYQLKNNISTLLVTARGEITRKDKAINELRTELENLKFRRLGSQSHPNYQNQKPRPEVNTKPKSTDKPQPPFYNFQRTILNRPIREIEERQTPSVSGCNVLRLNNHIFPSNIDNEHPRIQIKQETDVKWYIQPVSPSHPHREEQTAEAQLNDLHNLKNDLITPLVPNHDRVKMEKLDISELDIKQEVIDERYIAEIRAYNDRKRKRYSPSPRRKISKHSAPSERTYSPERNTHCRVSKARSRENNTSRVRQSRRPRNRKRIRWDNDCLIDGKQPHLLTSPQ